jgi:elongation factor P
VDADAMGEALNYLDDGMEAELVIYNERPIAVEIPNTVVREIAHTEPAVRGDTSGKVLKPATLKNGHVINVPLFCGIGDKIEINTETGEYRSRAK